MKKTLFPYAKIECARFKGTGTQVFLDQATFDGPVFGASDACMEFIKLNISLAILWNEIKSKALLTQKNIKKIHAAKKLKKR